MKDLSRGKFPFLWGQFRLKIGLPAPVFSDCFAKAREPGRFAWPHEALISPWMRRGETPAPCGGWEKHSTFPKISRPMLPARIVLAPGPNRGAGEEPKRGEGPSRTLNGGKLLAKE